MKEDLELQDISGVLAELEQVAQRFFNAPVMTDLELLEKAQREHLLIDDVLPALQHPIRADAKLDGLYHEQFLTGTLPAPDFLIILRRIATEGYPELINEQPNDGNH